MFIPSVWKSEILAIEAAKSEGKVKGKDFISGLSKLCHGYSK